MRASLFIVLILSVMQLRAQDSIWFTRSGHIYFISHTPLIDIDAHNHQVGSMLNLKTGEMVFTLLMKTFQFTLPLAEEHFNENYVESEKFPKSTFKGRIVDFDPGKLTEASVYPVEVEGELTIHGITRKVRESGTLRREKDTIRAVSKFNILLKDFNIKVPAIVADRVAPVIPIDVEIIFKPMTKTSIP